MKKVYSSFNLFPKSQKALPFLFSLFLILSLSSVNVNAQGICVADGNNNNCANITTEADCNAANNCTWQIAAPVELSNFQFKQERNGIKLIWSTASEINNRGFEIQHTTNGLDWEAISFVEGYGNSISQKNYELLVQPKDGKNYYRLNQVDFDGHSNLSEVIVVEIKNGQVGSSIYPNPTKQDFVNLDYQSISEDELMIQIFDLMGKEVLRVNSAVVTGFNNIQINLNSLSSGSYLIKTTQGNLTANHKLIIK